MSLTRIALRLAAVEALRGRTLVGTNVLDSQIGAIDAGVDGSLSTDQDAPFIAVYTDAARVEADQLAPRRLHENGSCDLVLEVGITAMMAETDAETGQSLVIGLPATDAAFEMTLDLIVRQAFDALLDAGDPWAQVFQGLCERIVKVERARVGNASAGVRLAAQEVRLTVAMAEDPACGAPLDPRSAMAQLLDLLATGTAAQQTLGARIASILGAGGPDWEVQRRRLGLSATELASLGTAPLAVDAAGDAPLLAEVAVETGIAATVVAE